MTNADDGLTYEELKALAKEEGRPLESMYALSGSNDPFIVDMPRRQEAAEWFARFWREFAAESSRLHIRRIHYRLISSTRPFQRPNGEAYENTEACWDALCNAGRDARYLGLIPRGPIIDRRNPEPMIYIADEELKAAVISGSSGWLESLSLDDLPEPKLWLPGGVVEPPVIPQRYHLEMFCEKSTANDILFPLGEQNRVNVVTGVGEMSLTRVEELIERIRTIGRTGRRVRIIYVSDFDPAGLGMPVSVARKIEYDIRNEREAHDIQLRWVVLTHEQCVQYRLPRTPLKETERRAEKFEARFGEGATELDALEALHPGELRRILQREIDRYRDRGLARRISNVTKKARDDVIAAERRVRARHAEAIAQVEADHEALVSELAELRERIADLQSEFEDGAQPVFDAIEADLAAELPSADDYEWPEPKGGDEDDDPLYDSSREYFDQLARYREHQGKPEDASFKLHNLICKHCGEPFQSRRPHARMCSRKCWKRWARERGAKW